MRPRVGIVGPRRVRQGLGPFVARELEAAGARVPGFVASSAGAIEAAGRELASRYGVRARGYLDLRELAEAEADE